MKQDQMSMAASIESRVPFLDHPLVEFAGALPLRMKLRGVTTKYILREAMKASSRRRSCRARRWASRCRRYYGDFGDIGRQRALTTSLVLKAPGPGGEKGVLYCSFEYNWMRIIAHHDARALLAEYSLVGASSWSPPDFTPLAAFGGISAEPLFIGISNLSDVEAYGMMRPTVEPLPILASDWVDPGAYAPRPHAERTIDLLMVAHWGRFKRHWLLWEALRGCAATSASCWWASRCPGAASPTCAPRPAPSGCGRRWRW
jgi:hypothetical protein